MKRNPKVYILIMVGLVLIGLPARTSTIQEHMPTWYTQYFGDFLWAMLIYFLYANVFKLKIKVAFFIAIATTYLIEISQLFKPDWLEYVRSTKIFGLILGYGFLWSDLIAYTLGISLGALIDRKISKSG